MPPNLIDRLGAKFTFDSDGCWRWTRPLANGYGQMHSDGRDQCAHRVMYELLRGPIPEGSHLHHRCEEPACVNPEHLTVVTPREHSAAHLRDECPQGHAFTPENTYVTRQGWRQCRRCKIEQQRVRRAAR